MRVPVKREFSDCSLMFEATVTRRNFLKITLASGVVHMIPFVGGVQKTHAFSGAEIALLGVLELTLIGSIAISISLLNEIIKQQKQNEQLLKEYRNENVIKLSRYNDTRYMEFPQNSLYEIYNNDKSHDNFIKANCIDAVNNPKIKMSRNPRHLDNKNMVNGLMASALVANEDKVKISAGLPIGEIQSTEIKNPQSINKNFIAMKILGQRMEEAWNRGALAATKNQEIIGYHLPLVG